MASSTGYYLGKLASISSIVHIGGDAVIGIRLPDAALMFETIRDGSYRDFRRNRFVAGGRIGELIVDRKITKPVIAYIGGKAAREATALQPRRRDN